MIRSISDYVNIVKGIARVRSVLPPEQRDLWFRGSIDRTHHLQPGLYWRGIGSLEMSLTTQFASMGLQFVPKEEIPPHNAGNFAEWEWYFLMQHYGLPTRLLDWTEDPLAGMYFALSTIADRASPAAIPCVWVLFPVELIRLTVQNDPELIMPGLGFTQHWLYARNEDERPDRCWPALPSTFAFGGIDFSNKYPLAIQPIRRSRRIIAQRGVFTVHGAANEGIDEFLGYDDDPGLVTATSQRLVRLEIDPAAVREIWADLRLFQKDDLSMFPEAPMLSEYLKQYYDVGRGRTGSP